jgi:hypothetical protein
MSFTPPRTLPPRPLLVALGLLVACGPTVPTAGGGTRGTPTTGTPVPQDAPVAPPNDPSVVPAPGTGESPDSNPPPPPADTTADTTDTPADTAARRDSIPEPRR